MSVPTCRHVMENGQFCQSPALKKRDYCYFHQEFRARRLKMARARSRSERWWLDLPCIEDLASCAAANSRVIEGMAARVIEPELGKQLLSGLRLSASIFKARKAWVHRKSDYHNDCSVPYVSAYPGFEEFHDLPEDIDLDANPLQLFPMPEEASELRATSHEPNDTVSSSRPANSKEPSAPFKPFVGLSGNEETVPQVRDLRLGANLGPEGRAQLLNDAATPVDYMGLEVTADDIEVWEIAEREGEQASWKRAAELERNRRQRERRLQRARYEQMARNRNIQTAAMRIARDEKRAAAERQRQAAAVLGIPTAPSATQTAADAIGHADSASVPNQPGRKPAKSEAAQTPQAAAGTA